jgi:hypothetical protein
MADRYEQRERPPVQTRRATLRSASVDGERRVVVQGNRGGSVFSDRDLGILLQRERFMTNADDPHVQILIKRILKLTLIMAIVAIVRNIVLLYYQHYTSLIEMLLPLMIPYCGYEGARRRNRA